MSGVLLQVLLILLLLVLNGVFAMSEIAVVSARKSRLEHRAAEGSAGARRALALSHDPSRFLATVQVGITLVGILAGAFGGATLAEPLAVSIARVPALAEYAELIALGLVVLAITYASLILGELVPKRIGLNNPERIAAAVAGPMAVLSKVTHPMVVLLTASTEAVVRLLGIRKSDEPPVTEAEVSGLIEQGTRAGVFTEEEQELVERTFWLADQRVVAVMTPRVDVVWMDANDPPEAHRQILLQHTYEHFPLCDGSLDRVIGMVSVRDLWAAEIAGTRAGVGALAREPLVVPASVRALQVLQVMRESGTEVALVVDEYGGTDGLVTLHDILEEIVGDFHQTGGPAEAEIVRRDDGTLLVDGSVLMDELRDVLGLDERRGDERLEFRTVGGYVASALGRVPRAGDVVDTPEFRVEVVDMDRHRVDKVLVTPAAKEVLSPES
ncbi:MAG TPA: hemolysin family protein [Longimicrobium sp.]|nr:hemolysin family protein [Longimicrobium sp.]